MASFPAATIQTFSHGLLVYDLCPVAHAAASDTYMPTDRLQRRHAALQIPDANDLIDLVKEDLPIADLAGRGGLGDRVYRLVHVLVFQNDFDLDLGQKVDAVFVSVIH